ncbi:MAG: polyphenol oxidase family protein [Ktedonobacterales bacterium]
MIQRSANQCEYLLFDHLNTAPQVAHGVFTKHGGFSGPPFNGLNASSSTGDDPATVRRNQAMIAEAVRLPLVSAHIAHGNQVCVVERLHTHEPVEDVRARLRQTTADAMVCAEPGIGLFWAFGDCSPILLYDPRHRVVALAHGGWRGAAGAIGPCTLAVMAERYGTRPQEVLAGMGPGIEACCYAVNEAVREQFARTPDASESAVFVEREPVEQGADPLLFLDVTHSNTRQLLAAGILPEHLEESGYCTGCTGADLFYSHRKHPESDGRFGVVIGLREE